MRWLLAPRRWAVLALRMIALALAGRLRPRDSVRQAYEIGNRSLAFLLFTMGFLGMVMVLQACFQARRLVGDYSVVGPAFLQLLARELAPTIGALMLATRVGSGIAAELGSMTVTEQIDGLRMCGADPIEELVLPRWLASLLMVPALLVLAGLAAEISGLLAARVAFEVPYAAFLSTRMVSSGDVVVGCVKAVLYGGTIPIISAAAGLEARGGSAGVGSATTRAVIDTSLAIIILDFAVNVVLYPLYQRAG